MHILHAVLFTSPNKENVFNDQNLLLFVGDLFLNILETLMFDSGGYCQEKFDVSHSKGSNC